MSLTELFSFAGVAFSVLFPLINPVGAVPAFSSLTGDDTPEFRKSQAKKTALNIFIILTIFLLIGKLLLDIFGISLGVLKIAGGLIVAHTAWEMVTSKSNPEEGNIKIQNIDISFMPLAIPILSGPGAIGLVIGLSTSRPLVLRLEVED